MRCSLFALAILTTFGCSPQSDPGPGPTEDLAPPAAEYVALSSDDPSSWSADEVALIGAAAGTHTVVGLGEAIHASEAIIAAKRRILLDLVEHHGFRRIAWEAARGGAERLDAYLATCASPLSEAIFDLDHGAWLNVGTRDVLTELCAWNQAHPDDRVHVFGFDLWDPWAERATLVGQLRRVSPADADRIDAAIGRCPGLATYASWRAWYDDYQPFPVTSPADDAACDAGLRDAEQTLVVLEDRVATTLGASAAGVLPIARALLAAWPAFYKYQQDYDANRADLSLLRDAVMARALLASLALEAPGTKTVVWGAQSHLAHRLDESLSFDDGRPYVTMGSFLSDALDDAYYVVAVSAAEITSATSSGTFYADTPTALDAVLSGTGAPATVVDLHTPAGRWALLRPEAEYGVFQNGSLVDVSPARQFDAYVSVRRSKASRWFP